MKTDSIEIKTTGDRGYLVGDTYPLRDKLRELGARWDSGTRAWTVSLSEVDRVAEALGAEVSAMKVVGPPKNRRAEIAPEKREAARKAVAKLGQELTAVMAGLDLPVRPTTEKVAFQKVAAALKELRSIL